MMSGNREKHDLLILEASKKIASQVDVIVLAQGSMARMEQLLAKETGKIVLSSPFLGVLGVKDLFKRRNEKVFLNSILIKH